MSEELDKMIFYSGCLAGALSVPENAEIFKTNLKENVFLYSSVKVLRDKLTEALGEPPGKGRRKTDISNFDSAFDKLGNANE